MPEIRVSYPFCLDTNTKIYQSSMLTHESTEAFIFYFIFLVYVAYIKRNLKINQNSTYEINVRNIVLSLK